MKIVGVFLKFLRIGIALLIGGVLAEGALKLAMAPMLDYGSGFRPGPYCRNDEVSTFLPCPNFFGFQRSPEAPRYLPLHLNRYGQRGPTRSTVNPDASARTVVIVGGQSQMFGWGLNDEETIAAMAARHSCIPVTVHNMSFVGATNESSWLFFERVALKEIKPDHLIYAVYWRSGNIDALSRPEAYDQPMALLNGWIFIVPNWFASELRNSQLAVRLVRRFQPVLFAFGLWPRIPIPVQSKESRLVELIHQLSRFCAERGIQFSVLLMPWNSSADTDEALRAQLSDLNVIDANTRARTTGLISDLFPDGHYRPRQAEMIGSMIAEDICAHAGALSR